MVRYNDRSYSDARADKYNSWDYRRNKTDVFSSKVIEESSMEYYERSSRSASYFGKVYSGLYPVGPKLPSFSSSNKRSRLQTAYNEDDFSSSPATSSIMNSDDKMYIDFPIRNFWKIAKTPIDMESPQIGYCRGFYYRLLVHPRGGSCNDSESSYLSVFLEALYHESYPDDWVFPNVRFQLSVVNFLDPKANITSWAHWTFSHDAMSRGWHKMVSHVRLTKAAGFVDEEGTVLIRGRAEPPFPRIWSRSPKCRPLSVWGTLPYRHASVFTQYKPCILDTNQNHHSHGARMSEKDVLTAHLCKFHELAEKSNKRVFSNVSELEPQEEFTLIQYPMDEIKGAGVIMSSSMISTSIPLSIMDRLIWSSSNLLVPALRSQLNVDFVPAFIHLLYHIKEFRRAVFSWNPQIPEKHAPKKSQGLPERSKKSESPASPAEPQASIIEALQKTFAYMTLWPIAYSVKRSLRHSWQERISADPSLVDDWCFYKCCKCGSEFDFHLDHPGVNAATTSFPTHGHARQNLSEIPLFRTGTSVSDERECYRCKLPPAPDCSWIMKALSMNDLQKMDVSEPLMRFHCFIFGAIYLESAHVILRIAANHRKLFPQSFKGLEESGESGDSGAPAESARAGVPSGDVLARDPAIPISSILELEEDLRVPTEFDNTCRVLFSSMAEEGGDCFSDYSTCCLRAKHVHSVPKAIEHYAHRFKRFPETLFVYLTPPKNAKKGELFDVPFRLEASFLLERNRAAAAAGAKVPVGKESKFPKPASQTQSGSQQKSKEPKVKSKTAGGKEPRDSDSARSGGGRHHLVLGSEPAPYVESNDECSLEYASEDGSVRSDDSPEDSLDDKSDRKSADSDNFFGSSSQYMEKWYSLYGVVIREGDISGDNSAKCTHQLLIRPEEDGPWFRICDGSVERLVSKIEFTEWKCHGGFFCAAAVYVAEDYIDSVTAGDVLADCDIKSINPKLYKETLDLLEVTEEELQYIPSWVSTQVNSNGPSSLNLDMPSSDIDHPAMCVDIANVAVCDSTTCVFGHPLMDSGLSIDPRSLWMLVDYRWGLPRVNSHFQLQEPLTQAFPGDPSVIISGRTILTPQAYGLVSSLAFSSLRDAVPKFWSMLLEIMLGPEMNSKDLSAILQVVPHLRSISANIFLEIYRLLLEFGVPEDPQNLLISHTDLHSALEGKPLPPPAGDSFNSGTSAEDRRLSRSDHKHDKGCIREYLKSITSLEDDIVPYNRTKSVMYPSIPPRPCVIGKTRTEVATSYRIALSFVTRLHTRIWPHLVHFVYELLPVAITIRLKRLLYKNNDDLLFDPRLTPEDLCARFLTESKFLIESSCCPLNLIRFCDNKHLLNAAISQVAGALDTCGSTGNAPPCSLSCPTNRMVDRFACELGSSNFVVPILVYITQILISGALHRASSKLLPPGALSTWPTSSTSQDIVSLMKGLGQPAPKDATPSKHTGSRKKNSSSKSSSNSASSGGQVVTNPLSEAIQHIQVNQVTFSHIDPYVFIPLHAFHAVSTPLLVGIIFEHDLIGRLSFASESSICASRVLHVNRLATVRNLYSAMRKALYQQFVDTKITSRLEANVLDITQLNMPQSRGGGTGDHNAGGKQQAASGSQGSKKSSSNLHIPVSLEFDQSESSWIPSNPLDVFCLYSLKPDTDPTRKGRLKYTYMHPNDFLEVHCYAPHKSNYVANCDVAILMCVPPELKLQVPTVSNGLDNVTRGASSSTPSASVSSSSICAPVTADLDPDTGCLYTCPSHIAHSPACQSSRTVEKTIPKIVSPLFKCRLVDPLWSSTKFPMNDDSVAPLLIFKWFDRSTLDITLLSASICEARKSLRDCIVSWVFPRARKMGLMSQNSVKETPNADDYTVLEECQVRVCQNVRRWTSSIKKINRTTGDVFIVQKRSNSQGSSQPIISDCPFITPFVSAAVSSNSYSGLIDESAPPFSKDELLSIITSINSKKTNNIGIFNSAHGRNAFGNNSLGAIEIRKGGVDKSWLVSASPIGDIKLPSSPPSLLDPLRGRDNSGDILASKLKDLNISLSPNIAGKTLMEETSINKLGIEAAKLSHKQIESKTCMIGKIGDKTTTGTDQSICAITGNMSGIDTVITGSSGSLGSSLEMNMNESKSNDSKSSVPIMSTKSVQNDLNMVSSNLLVENVGKTAAGTTIAGVTYASVGTPGVTYANVGTPGVTYANVGTPGVAYANVGAPGVTYSNVGTPGVTYANVGAPGVTYASVGTHGVANTGVSGAAATTVVGATGTTTGVGTSGITYAGVGAAGAGTTGVGTASTGVGAPGVAYASVGTPGVTYASVGTPGVTYVNVGAPGVTYANVGTPGVTYANVGAPGVTYASLGTPGVTYASLGTPGVTYANMGAPGVTYASVGTPGVATAGTVVAPGGVRAAGVTTTGAVAAPGVVAAGVAAAGAAVAPGGVRAAGVTTMGAVAEGGAAGAATATAVSATTTTATTTGGSKKKKKASKKLPGIPSLQKSSIVKALNAQRRLESQSTKQAENDAIADSSETKDQEKYNQDIEYHCQELEEEPVKNKSAESIVSEESKYQDDVVSIVTTPKKSEDSPKQKEKMEVKADKSTPVRPEKLQKVPEDLYEIALESISGDSFSTSNLVNKLLERVVQKFVLIQSGQGQEDSSPRLDAFSEQGNRSEFLLWVNGLNDLICNLSLIGGSKKMDLPLVQKEIMQLLKRLLLNEPTTQQTSSTTASESLSSALKALECDDAEHSCRLFASNTPPNNEFESGSRISISTVPTVPGMGINSRSMRNGVCNVKRYRMLVSPHHRAAVIFVVILLKSLPMLCLNSVTEMFLGMLPKTDYVKSNSLIKSAGYKSVKSFILFAYFLDMFGVKEVMDSVLSIQGVKGFDNLLTRVASYTIGLRQYATSNFIVENMERIRDLSLDWVSSLRITDKLAISEEILKGTLVAICDYFSAKSDYSDLSQNKKTLDLIQSVEGIVRFSDIDDFDYEEAQLSEMRKVGKDAPRVLVNKEDICIILKPPFWYCPGDEDKDGKEELSYGRDATDREGQREKLKDHEVKGATVGNSETDKRKKKKKKKKKEESESEELEDVLEKSSSPTGADQFEEVLNSGRMESISSFLRSRAEQLGLDRGGGELGIASATFGLRLGVEIGGPVLVVKSQKAREFYEKSEIFSQIQCQYVFLSHGQIPNSSDKNVSLSNIVSNASNKIFSKCLSSDGGDSITKFKVCEHIKFRNYNKGSPSTFSLCTCISKPGNVNKIRAYMHQIGHTIVGDSVHLGQKQLSLDRKYFPNIFLYCTHLEIPRSEDDVDDEYHCDHEDDENNYLQSRGGEEKLSDFDDDNNGTNTLPKDHVIIDRESIKVVAPISREVLEQLESDFEITEKFNDVHFCSFYRRDIDFEENPDKVEKSVQISSDADIETRVEDDTESSETKALNLATAPEDDIIKSLTAAVIDIDDDFNIESSINSISTRRDFELPMISSLPGLGLGLTPFLGMPNSQYAGNNIPFSQDDEISLDLKQSLGLSSTIPVLTTNSAPASSSFGFGARGGFLSSSLEAKGVVNIGGLGGSNTGLTGGLAGLAGLGGIAGLTGSAGLAGNTGIAGLAGGNSGLTGGLVGLTGGNSGLTGLAGGLRGGLAGLGGGLTGSASNTSGTGIAGNSGNAENTGLGCAKSPVSQPNSSGSGEGGSSSVPIKSHPSLTSCLSGQSSKQSDEPGLTGVGSNVSTGLGSGGVGGAGGIFRNQGLVPGATSSSPSLSPSSPAAASSIIQSGGSNISGLSGGGGYVSLSANGGLQMQHMQQHQYQLQQQLQLRQHQQNSAGIKPGWNLQNLIQNARWTSDGSSGLFGVGGGLGGSNGGGNVGGTGLAAGAATSGAAAGAAGFGGGGPYETGISSWNSGIATGIRGGGGSSRGLGPPGGVNLAAGMGVNMTSSVMGGGVGGSSGLWSGQFATGGQQQLQQQQLQLQQQQLHQLQLQQQQLQQQQLHQLQLHQQQLHQLQLQQQQLQLHQQQPSIIVDPLSQGRHTSSSQLGLFPSIGSNLNGKILHDGGGSSQLFDSFLQERKTENLESRQPKKSLF